MQNTMVVKGKLSFQITPVCEISSIGTYIFFLIQKTKQRKVRLHNQSREHTASPSSTQRRHPTPDNKKNIKSQKKSTSCFASFGVSRVYILKGLLRREVEERGLFLFFLDLFERCPCAHVVTSPLDHLPLACAQLMEAPPRPPDSLHLKRQNTSTTRRQSFHWISLFFLLLLSLSSSLSSSSLFFSSHNFMERKERKITRVFYSLEKQWLRKSKI